MKFPTPTTEQYERFRREFAEYYEASEPERPDHFGDRTEQEETWCRARAYTEGNGHLPEFAELKTAAEKAVFNSKPLILDKPSRLLDLFRRLESV